MMNPNQKSEDPTAKAIVDLVSLGLAEAYVMGVKGEVEEIDSLHYILCVKLACLLDEFEEGQKNSIAACN